MSAPPRRGTDASAFASPEAIAFHVRATRDRRELSRWLHENVPKEIAALIDEVLAGKLKLRVRPRPLPTKERIERDLAWVQDELRNYNSDASRAARALNLSLDARHLPAAARGLVALLHRISPRTLKEIRYPAPGRAKVRR